MNRRTALFWTMLLGGLAPGRLVAQAARRRAPARGADADEGDAVASAATKSRRGQAAAVDEVDPQAPPAAEDSPGTLPSEAGFQWRNFDIRKYTGLAHSQNQANPQNAVVEWIFRRTGSAPWHGERLAILSAGRSQIRAYQEPKILDQVHEVVERFTDSVSDLLSIRVRFVAAVDTRWRYAVYSRLTPVGSGPQGQQVWTLKVEDSAFVLAQMQVQQGFRLLTDQRVEMVNGQTLSVKTSETRAYSGGMQRESAVGLGYQPRADQLEEGVTLRLSPLLTYEGDMLDAAIELTANTIKTFHRTKVIAPREIGPSEMNIDVPEVVESRLNQTVKAWPLGQTLLISAGIQPGILQSKTGFMNLRIPGTVPTSTELLVFIEAETAKRAGSSRG